MRTHTPPPASVPEPSEKPAQPPADAPPSGLGAAPKPARDGTLFHLLMERGWDPELAYTGVQRMHAMTSEIVAAGLQPVMAELRQMRESMVTKADLAERETRLIKWMFGAMLAQTAVIVGIVVGVVPLLR